MQISTTIEENNMEVPEKIKSRTTMYSSNPTIEYIFQENENCMLKISALPHSLQHFSQQLINGNNLSVS
jgi:hypothetical protein